MLGPRFNLRVEDITDAYGLCLQCEACGHTGIVPGATLRQVRQGYERIVQLDGVFRCSKCRRSQFHWWTVKL